MTEPLIDFDTFIYNEMMAHPVLFTHRKATKVALIDHKNSGIAQEILQHPQVRHLAVINPVLRPQELESNPRVQWQPSSTSAWLASAQPESFDVIIIADTSELPAFTPTGYEQYLRLLTQDGILLCQSDTLFQLHGLKSTYQAMHRAGFHDLQVLHFPQPGVPFGSKAAIMAGRKGAFKRVREQDVFNKPFMTRYYNFDVHHAALVMPEFMREELTAEN